MDVDFVSHSCYDSLQRGFRDDLHAALDHLESKPKPKPGIPGKRVFIGEYGFPARRYPPEVTDRKSIETMIATLEWGCPFVLYWELYDNEGEAMQAGAAEDLEYALLASRQWKTQTDGFQPMLVSRIARKAFALGDAK